MSIQIKRIYDPAVAADGERILVDRLWPRGVSKEHAALTLWMKNIAPSTELREWFGHKAERMGEFTAKYRAELDHDSEKQAAVADLVQRSKKDTVTLLYGAKDPQINHAAVLADYIRAKL